MVLFYHSHKNFVRFNLNFSVPIIFKVNSYTPIPKQFPFPALCRPKILIKFNC